MRGAPLRLYLLEIEREIRGQDGLFEQLHEVAVLRGRQVGEDVVTLWTERIEILMQC